MAKKERGGRSRKNKGAVIEKLLDQSYSTVLSFILATGLIGGCGYLLFTLPAEKTSLDRQIAEFGNEASKLSYFNEILRVFGSGWFVDQAELKHDSEIITYLASKRQSTSLDPSFVNDTLNWITTTVLRLNSEKGTIQGFALTNELEKSCQQDILRQYTAKSEALTKTADVIRNWQYEKPTVRDRRWAEIENLSRELVGNSHAILSKATQLRDQTRSIGQDADLKSNELNGQIRTVFLKEILSGAGVLAGLIVLGYLFLVAGKKRA